MRRGQTVTVQKRDSNSWTVTVQVFVNEKPHVLPFQHHKFSLNRSSITPDIIKNLRIGQTETVKKRDSNSWTVTVQVCVNERF